MRFEHDGRFHYDLPVVLTAVPLTLQRHAGRVPASRKLLKPLDSGLRRNDEKGLPAFMFQFTTPAYKSQSASHYYKTP